MIVWNLLSFAQYEEKYSRIPKNTDGRKPANRGEQTETRAIFSFDNIVTFKTRRF